MCIKLHTLFFPFLHPVVYWRHSYLLLEECSEGRGVGEAKRVGYLLDGLVGIHYQEDGALGDGLEHELLHGASRYRLHHLCEVFRRQT